MKKLFSEKFHINDFKLVRERWNHLYNISNSNNPFLSSDWIESYFNFYNNKTKNCYVIFLTINKKNDLGGMIIQDSFLQSSFLKDKDHIDYSGFLINFNLLKKFNLNYTNFFYGLKKTFIQLNMTPKIEYISKIFNENNLYFSCYERTINPVIDLDLNFKIYFSSRSKKLKQEIRTISNKQSSTNQLKFKVATSTNEKEKLIELLYKYHLDRQTVKLGESIFKNSTNKDFYRYLILKSTFADKINLSYLDYGKTTISIVLSIVIGGYFYYWIPSFNKNFSKLSPGKYHIYSLISYCYEKKMKEFNFMGGDEKYKFQWANRVYSLYNYWGSDKLLIYLIMSSTIKLFNKFNKNQNLIRLKNSLINFKI